MRLVVSLDRWGLIGGSERYAGLCVEGLAARGHEVHVLAGAEAAPRLALPAGARLLLHPAYSAEAPAPGELASLVREARSLAPQALFVLSCFRARTFAALGEVAPIVRFVQDHTLFCPSLNKIGPAGENCTRPLGVACLERYFLGPGCSCFRQSGRVRPWIEGLGEFRKKLAEFERAKHAARLVVASRYMERELVAAGAPAERVSVIPYFVRPPRTPHAPRASGGRGEGTREPALPLILAPARLVLPDKGLDVLLDALAAIRAPFRAEIPGDGPARAWLEARARALGLAERVRFPGWLDAGALAERYAAARAVAFPSTWQEPFGLVGIEAAAHAKPVVAFDVGGVGEWLDARGGFLHARGDVAGFANSLERLVTDEALAERLGAAGRERAAREFGEREHLDRLESVLLAAAR